MAGGLEDALEAKLRAMPAMSGTATKLLALLKNPNTNATQIEAVVRYDPGLTANILKLANSAYFGIPGRIGSIRQAVVRLGWKQVFQLVVASSVHAVMEKPVLGYDLLSGELWRHAIAVTVAAEDLARSSRNSGIQDIFTAALLHDVGKLVLGNFVDADYARLAEAMSRGVPFQQAEREVLGTDHAEMGARVLQKWSFPDALVNGARWHHDPDAADPQDPLIDIVHVADVLCLTLGFGIGREGLEYQASEGAMERLGIESDQLKMTASRVAQGVEELSNALKPDARPA